MVTLGIDPGLSLTGYAAIRENSAVSGAIEIIEAGVFRFNPKRSVSARLAELEADLRSLIERTEPERICVENLFAHFAHPRTAIIMAHARGVILLTAAKFHLPLVELSPATVKKAVTGNGRATKAQIGYAVATVLGLASLPEPADIADAIAIAMCGTQRPAVSEVRTAESGEPRRRVKLRG